MLRVAVRVRGQGLGLRVVYGLELWGNGLWDYRYWLGLG